MIYSLNSRIFGNVFPLVRWHLGWICNSWIAPAQSSEYSHCFPASNVVNDVLNVAKLHFLFGYLLSRTYKTLFLSLKCWKVTKVGCEIWLCKLILPGSQGGFQVNQLNLIFNPVNFSWIIYYHCIHHSPYKTPMIHRHVFTLYSLGLSSSV